MNTARRRVRFAVLAVVGLGTSVLLPGGAAAQHSAATTAGQSTAQSSVQASIEVVASGLNAPRGLVYDEQRQRVLVAEAGIAAENTGPCGFAERGLFMCLGHTGSVLQYSEASGGVRRVVTGLPSTALQGGPTVVIGLHDLSLHEGRLTGAFGLLGSKPYRESLGAGAALLGQVASLDEGEFHPFGDIATFIDQRYPNNLESDPYGLLTGSFGTVVANAGGHSSQGNNLLLVGRHGAISELAQFPDRPALADPTDMITSVPTSVARGPDGAFYVGELSGAPFYPGEARVWRVVPGQPPAVFADGFTTIIDIAFDERGRLIVLQTGNNPFNTSLDGALIRVEPDGQRTVLASAGVKNPGGVAVAGPGVFYVTTMLASGGGVGELLKIRLSG